MEYYVAMSVVLRQSFDNTENSHDIKGVKKKSVKLSCVCSTLQLSPQIKAVVNMRKVRLEANLSR